VNVRIPSSKLRLNVPKDTKRVKPRADL